MEERAWYVVQTYSGMESAAKRNIDNNIKSQHMEDLIFNVLVPEVTDTERKKNGELKEIIVKPYPGYVFIDMIITEESWFMVRNTPMVTGFLGSSGGGAKPVPLQEDEIIPILKMCGLNTAKPFEGKVGQSVRINAGTFSGQEGVIDSIELEKGIVKILINVFGRQTVAELEFNEVTIL